MKGEEGENTCFIGLWGISTILLHGRLISVRVRADEGVRKERIPGPSHYGGLRRHVG